MALSSFFKRLALLDKTEYKQLQKLAKGEGTTDLSKLLEFVKPAYPSFRDIENALRKENVKEEELLCAQLWPKQESKNKTLGRLKTTAIRLMDEILILKRLKENPHLREKILWEEVYKRDNNTMNHLQRLHKQESNLEKNTKQGAQRNIAALEIALRRFYHPGTNKHKAESTKRLQRCLDLLDNFYTSLKMELAFEAKTQERIHESEFTIRGLDSAKELARALEEVDELNYTPWTAMYLMVENGKTDFYAEKVYDILFEENRDLDQDLRLRLLIGLLNHESNKLNENHQTATLERMEHLYLRALDEDVLEKKEAEIDQSFLMNAFQVSITLEHLKKRRIFTAGVISNVNWCFSRKHLEACTRIFSF